MTKELVLTVVVRKEGTAYSAWCPELDVASQGDTIEEARLNLKGPLNCTLKQCSKTASWTHCFKRADLL